MQIIKNIKSAAKLRSLIKSLAVNFCLLSLFIAAAAFKSSADGDVKNPVKKDTLTDKNGFKSLFSATYFDPSKPYVTQLNPKAVPFVQDYLRRSGANLEKMKIWGKPYFDMYDGILSQYGLPVELKYLSVIESALIPGIVSHAGAVGPWQIMADEAKRMGLKINRRTDERTNFSKSTHAAARILKELNKQFNDWTLVIAAYNCGAGRVRQAIRKSGSRNFWDLQAYLPLETRNHVKRFIGTHYLFEGSGGLTTMTASEVTDFDLNTAATRENLIGAEDGLTGIVVVSGKYRANIVAKSLDMDIAAFKKLNPNFDKLVGLGKTYNLRLPADKVLLFNNKKSEILNESVQAFLNY